jgi:hypothetical protein
VYWSATVGNDELLDSHQRTAEQSLADGQETPNRTVYPEPAGSGTVWAVHVLPFQESAVGLWDPIYGYVPTDGYAVRRRRTRNTISLGDVA